MTDIDNVYLPFLSSLFVVCSSNFWQYMSPMAINVGVSAIQPKKKVEVSAFFKLQGFPGCVRAESS